LSTSGAQRPYRRPALCRLPPTPEDIVDPRIELFQPKPDDPAIRRGTRRNGTRYAITNTCAANVLGYANRVACLRQPRGAQRAMAALADWVGKSIEDIARTILDIATTRSSRWSTIYPRIQARSRQACSSAKVAARPR